MLEGDFDILLAKIGITGLDERRPRGFLRYVPEDFLVEELHHDGEACVRPTRSVPDDLHKSRRVLQVNLIKRGYTTKQAIEEICRAAGLEGAGISYAEEKDRNAITAQRVGFAKTSWEKLRHLKIPRVHLEPLRYHPEPVHPHSHTGNRFIAHVRTDGTEGKSHATFLADLLSRVGVKNYTPPRRFGAKLDDAKLGCYLARGDRAAACKHFGQEPTPEHMRQWVRAYEAWVRNRYLSVSHELPDELPSIFTPEGQNLYRDLLALDATTNLAAHLDRYKFLHLKPQAIPARLAPDISSIEKTDEGVRFTLTLPPRARIETVLLPFYKLQETRPVPGWVRGEGC